ncbi:Mog1p/PsbP-like protein [Dissoconium aciculare CBS 342.82]|uniref:Mog1p/PsbP-like protein n=1 Tax=Dissoconium aciculare CBS 342.82 TaxID=1314786 RepID=A0A6J3MC04_9PEZI|nr:Mog1p/PsbP-like protein [Dissoconium aciculare CBS 342.82]KAF1825134.1 Mog1p/PsbP-like protein [Dissoconium aciculare CBS 342.82]
MANFASKSLFGGAISVDLPPNFIDVSEVRQVPDNQEAYLDPDGFTSIVVEILERVESEGGDDEAAFREHFKELTDESEDAKILPGSIRRVDISEVKLPADVAIYTLDGSAPPGRNERDRQAAAIPSGGASESDLPGTATVTVLVALLRLKAQDTDILISVNVPEHDKANLLEAAKQLRSRMVSTFEIKDWGLFVQE